MNKKMIGAIAILCMLLCTLAFAPASVYADEYQYQVTVDGGLQGTVTGETKVEIANGGQWNPNDYMDKVTVKDKKYYLKGFQISGQEGLVGATKIDHDTDFVAVYGIKGDTVAYTVQYLDASGKELREARTFYGNVGDKPVAAYQYIDGYQPQAYNLTGTLTSNAAANLWTFRYEAVTAEAAGGASGGNGTGNGAADTNGAAGGNGATGGAAVQGESGASGNGGQDGAAVADADSQSQEPAEVIDLDDEETPLADSEQPAAEEEQGQKAGGHAIAYIVGGAAAVGILALILALLRRKTAEE